MASSTGGGWAQLRQQARSQETQTDTLFHTYSQYSSMSNIPPKPTEEELRTEAQLQDILEKRENLINQLQRLLDSEASASALKLNNLSRHREILQEHRRELNRLRSTIQEHRNKTNLLSTVRDDIQSYRSAHQDEADYMLEERRRVDSSNTMADSILSQAYAVNESFGFQRESLANINRRMTTAASQIPGINTLIGRIGAKKRRDSIILGSFIAFCFLLMLWFW